MSQPIHVTDDEFETKVLKSALPVIVDFWAGWCAPCRAITPTLERIALDFDGKVIVTKVDIDENPLSPQRYGVQGIPTLLLMRNGREEGRLVGAMPEAKIRAAVKEFLDHKPADH
jgi:thioredoxin 1